MEFYLSFAELAGKISNPVTAVFLPIFVIVTVLEAVVIIWRSGTYPWKNAGVSLCMALGHLITQAATHGLILAVRGGWLRRDSVSPSISGTSAG
jgi:hypothetical protein